MRPAGRECTCENDRSVFISIGLVHAQAKGDHWVATWGTSQTLVRPAVAATPRPRATGCGSGSLTPAKGPARRFGIPAPLAGLKNQTVRMVVRTSVGGRTLRVRLSNALNGSTVTIGAAHIALRGKDSAIVPASDRVLKFSGQPSATMFAGQMLVSDPVNLDLPPMADLAVSLYFPGETGPPTSHTFALQTTYLSKEGDYTGKPEIADLEGTRESWYWLAGVDVLAPANAGTLVTFGDSITDGDQSTPGTNGMWPTLLAARLQANKATSRVSVWSMRGSRETASSAITAARSPVSCTTC